MDREAEALSVSKATGESLFRYIYPSPTTVCRAGLLAVRAKLLSPAPGSSRDHGTHFTVSFQPVTF